MTPLTVRWPSDMQAPIRQHDLQAENCLARDPVLGAQQATRIGRDVAADGGDRFAGRIRREPESARGERRVQVVVQDARLHDRQFVVDVDLEDARRARASRARSLPRPPYAPPASPVPAPRGTTGMPIRVAKRIVACTSSTMRAVTRASGAPIRNCPERSSRNGSRSAGSIETAEPRAATNSSRTLSPVSIIQPAYNSPVSPSGCAVMSDFR